MKFKNLLIALILLVLTGITGFLFYERFLAKPQRRLPNESNSRKYTCPTGTINCMPGPRQIPEICNNEEYQNWAQINCPEFEGLVH
jgi:hypothetical protein